MATAGAGERAFQIIHDLNNALGLVINFATLAAEEVTDRPGVLDDLQEVRAAGERAADLVRELATVLKGGERST